MTDRTFLNILRVMISSYLKDEFSFDRLSEKEFIELIYNMLVNYEKRNSYRT